MKIKLLHDFDGVTKIPNAFDFLPFVKLWKGDFRPNDSETFQFLKNNNHRMISSFNTTLQPVIIESESIYSIPITDNFIGDIDTIYIYPIRVSELFTYSFNMEFKYNINLSIIDCISAKSKLFIDKSNFYYYIEYGWEGYFPQDFFHKVYYDLRKNNISANKVIFSTNTQNINKLHSKFLSNFPKETHIKFTHYNQCLMGKLRDYNESSYKDTNNTFVSEEYIKNGKSRNKKALILNRRLRYHRLYLLSNLAYDNLLDDNLVSFDMEMVVNVGFLESIRNLKLQNRYITNDEFFDKTIIGYNQLLKLNKRTLDYDSLDDVIGLGYESKELYENTYFSIVTETLFDDDEWFVSEKTFKPIIQLHPFVIVGSPHTLKYLKSYGFKTFDKWWDESYDEIENSNDRMLAVYDTIQSLIKKSTDEWDIIYNEITETLIHNKNVMLSLNENNSEINKMVLNNLFEIIKNSDYKKDIKLF